MQKTNTRGRPPIQGLRIGRMREMFNKGKTLREIGEKLGVSHTTVMRRLKREVACNKQEVVIERTSKKIKYIVVNQKIVTRRR